MAEKFDKFNPGARSVLTHALSEATKFRHSILGTEHLLLGLINVKDTNAAIALDWMGVELDAVRNEIVDRIGYGEPITDPDWYSGMSPRAKKVIELAVDESRRLNHDYIGAEHILLGIIREGDGSGIRTLQSFEVDLDILHEAVVQLTNSGILAHLLKLSDEDFATVPKVYKKVAEWRDQRITP